MMDDISSNCGAEAVWSRVPDAKQAVAARCCMVCEVNCLSNPASLHKSCSELLCDTVLNAGIAVAGVSVNLLRGDTLIIGVSRLDHYISTN